MRNVFLALMTLLVINSFPLKAQGEGAISQAQWITSQLYPTMSQRMSSEGISMPVFRKVVTLEKRPEEARLVATALGVYDIIVNGKRVEGHELKPGWTDYRKEVTYQALDITALLHKGENEIHAQLSYGWWGGEISRGVYGRNTPLAFKAAFEVNGQTVALTDETWQCSHDGPLLLGDIYDGEVYDARRVPTNWKNVQTVTDMDMAVIPFEGAEVRVRDK